MSCSVELQTAETLKLKKELAINSRSTVMVWALGFFNFFMIFSINQQQIRRLQEAMETFSG